MAHRDQFGTALGGLDAGNPGNGDDIAFFMPAGLDKMQGLCSHANPGPGTRLAQGLGLVANVDHACGAAGIEVGELAHRGCS